MIKYVVSFQYFTDRMKCIFVEEISKSVQVLQLRAQLLYQKFLNIFMKLGMK